jgi:HYDIN/CFA65/VesB family protein/glycosyl hydrolase family 123/carboxypeptidase family protein/Ig-like domain-containing protein
MKIIALLTESEARLLYSSYGVRARQSSHLRGPPPVPSQRADLSPEEMRKVKTDVRGWVCAVGALILSCSTALLSGCSGLVSSPNNNPSPTLLISNVQTGSVTTSGSQVIWTTSVPANSSVDYGTTTAYGSSTPVDSAMVTNHQVTLVGLAAGTTYYYQVNSTDAKGYNGHHGNTFKTAGFRISGTINPTADGNGATVSLSGAASASATPDSSGNYTFTGLPNGTYTIVPSRAGFTFTPGSQSIAINGANVTGVNFTATSQTFSISGTINPVAGGSGATVKLSGAASATTTANGAGAYTLTGLTSGSYSITPSNAGYTFTPPSQNVTVSAANVSGVNFTDNAVVVAPTITTQPANQTVAAGQTASFSVTATGTAPLSYQWKKNGAAITGATSSSYTTPTTTSSDNGAQFTAVVSNTAGSVTSSTATLTVNAAAVAPSITTQPASQTVTAGQTATFSVAATGTAPLSYQWQKSGTNIAGATSTSYTTPATTTSDSGSTFQVVVTNSAGSVTSSAATLTVNAASYLLSASPTSLSFGNVNTGSSSTLAVTLKNSGNSNVSISNIAISGAGFNVSGVSAGTILTPGQSATLNVSFAPAATGSVTGSVTVASNATNSPATVSLSGNGVQASAAFPVWVSPGLLRVGQTDAPGTTSSISLSSARGETVDTQVIMQAPAGGLTNVNLSASALTGPNGASIPSSNITLYREYYIAVTGTAGYGGGSNPPLGSGTYPEPLIPFNDPETGASLCGSTATLKACNASISAGQNQPYWIDISVPGGATNSPPGTYTGTIYITTAQGNATIPISLTVWNFGLAKQPSELSLWTLWPPASGNTTATLARALMRNKVMDWYDVASNASSDISTLGLNRSGLDNYYYIGIQCSGSYSSLPSSSQISTAAANFPAGLGLDFYVADELNGCTSAYSSLKTMGTNAHNATPSVKTMMTTNAPDPNLYNEGDGRSAIDHWVVLDSMQQWPALPFTGAGDLWSYASCNTGFGNTPEWMVDYPPINERIQAGFLNWTQEATGILYYRADGWTNGNTITSWNNVDTTACGSGLGRPGDGIFLYPPAPIASTESAPGIRLKAIRDGIQDYEYAQILKNLGQLNFLNPIIAPIATSWTKWTHDPNALQNARLQLGQQLNQLAPPTP